MESTELSAVLEKLTEVSSKLDVQIQILTSIETLLKYILGAVILYIGAKLAYAIFVKLIFGGV